MNIPVTFNGVRKTTTIAFANHKDPNHRDLDFLEGWKKCSIGESDPDRREAADLAELAVSRFLTHSAIMPYAQSVGEIQNHIKYNPHAEVGNLILLKADWFAESRVIGVCHFRRSWKNNVILDYVAVHPLIIGNSEGHPNYIRGTGEALMYFAATVAKELDSRLIWGEATPGSYKYYERKFKLDGVGDLLAIDRDAFLNFLAEQDRKWMEQSSSAATTAAPAKISGEDKTNSSPLLGSKTAVFRSPRQLAEHFLELPYQEQIDVAKTLDLLQNQDSGQQEFELFRRIFQRATESRKLAELWTEVEKRHKDGEPSNNPFLNG